MIDNVNHPRHYTNGDIECIDAIQSAVTNMTGFEGYCTGNAIKYIWRQKNKNGKEDLEKAKWYIDKLIATENDETKACFLCQNWINDTCLEDCRLGNKFKKS